MNKIARFYRWPMDRVHYFPWKYLFGFIFRPLIVNSGVEEFEAFAENTPGYV